RQGKVPRLFAGEPPSHRRAARENTCQRGAGRRRGQRGGRHGITQQSNQASGRRKTPGGTDRKSTRLNSSHLGNSYAVFCLNKKNLSSSKGPKPLQLKLLTTYIPKTSAFTLAFSTSQRLRTTRASARTFFTFRHYITPSARNF